MTERLPDLPRYIRERGNEWQGADHQNGPWRPIPAPQSGLPWRTEPEIREPTARHHFLRNTMKLELEFGHSLCYTLTFTINGIDADQNDFGEKYDRAPEDAEDYPCGDMQFTRVPAKPEVLAKYGITGPEYELIAGQLEVGLSFGSCGWCV